MIRTVRRMITVACLAALAAVAASGPAAARPVPPVVVVDGFAAAHLPAGLGPLQSDFTYHSDGVTFRSHVWERGPDAAGAYAVDLTVKVLRGPGLTDVGALREFLAAYHEQDPAGWREVEPGRAYLRPGAVLRFVEPGVATEVSLDATRFDEAELLATAAGLRPAEAGVTPPG